VWHIGENFRGKYVYINIFVSVDSECNYVGTASRRTEATTFMVTESPVNFRYVITLTVLQWEDHDDTGISGIPSRTHVAYFTAAWLFKHVYKIAKAILCFDMSVRTYGTTPLPLDGFSLNLIFEYFPKICRENSISLKSQKNSRYFT